MRKKVKRVTAGFLAAIVVLGTPAIAEGRCGRAAYHVRAGKGAGKRKMDIVY